MMEVVNGRRIVGVSGETKLPTIKAVLGEAQSKYRRCWIFGGILVLKEKNRLGSKQAGEPKVWGNFAGTDKTCRFEGIFGATW
jgi:hypothetical protein